MSLKHVSHAEITRAEITRFAQDRVNLPKEKVDEFRAQAKRLCDRLETKAKTNTPSHTETAGSSNKGEGHQRATSVHKTQQQASLSIDRMAVSVTRTATNTILSPRKVECHDQ
jgi:hypothetical protein